VAGEEVALNSPENDRVELKCGCTWFKRRLDPCRFPSMP